jgi:hypothetical protein
VSGAFEPPIDCESFADDLAELALGTSEGRRRSEVLDHVASCPSCRVELQELSSVAEAVQQLTPSVQPPLGFEMRLAERLQGGVVVRPQPSRRFGARVLALAAAVVLFAFGVGALVATVVKGSDQHAAASGLVSANFTAGGKVVGDVLISNGDPGWMLVSTEGTAWKGPVTCEVTLADGTVKTIGTFTMSGDYGVWATPLDPAAGRVRTARLIDGKGTVLADAQVSA